MKLHKRKKDPRVTAPLISWKVMLTVFGILYLLTFAQAFILEAYREQIVAMIGMLSYYMICACVLVAVIIGFFWRYVIGKPISTIARAAQKVAAGDFSVQIENPPQGRQDE